jgi:hypothetical protein
MERAGGDLRADGFDTPRGPLNDRLEPPVLIAPVCLSCETVRFGRHAFGVGGRIRELATIKAAEDSEKRRNLASFEPPIDVGKSCGYQENLIRSKAW